MGVMNYFGVAEEEYFLPVGTAEMGDEAVIGALTTIANGGNSGAANILARLFSGNTLDIPEQAADGTIFYADEYRLSSRLVNPATAFIWSEKAAKGGRLGSLRDLASRCAGGIGCEKNPRRAIALMAVFSACSRNPDFIGQTLATSPELLAELVSEALGLEFSQG